MSGLLTRKRLAVDEGEELRDDDRLIEAGDSPLAEAWFGPERHTGQSGVPGNMQWARNGPGRAWR